MRGPIWGAGFAGLACLALLCIVVSRQSQSVHSILSIIDYHTGKTVELWGGDGLVTTGDYVDGRKTVPGLHTDCIPGSSLLIQY
jgi:hypothetical protein